MSACVKKSKNPKHTIDKNTVFDILLLSKIKIYKQTNTNTETVPMA